MIESIYLKVSIYDSDKQNHGRWSARIKRTDALLSGKEAYILTLRYIVHRLNTINPIYKKFSCDPGFRCG